MDTKQISTLSERKIAVADGTSGIGRSIAFTLSNQGADVFVVGTNKGKLYETFTKAAGKGIKINGDITGGNDGGIPAFFDSLGHSLGGFDAMIVDAAFSPWNISVSDFDEWLRTMHDGYARDFGYFENAARQIKHVGNIVYISPVTTTPNLKSNGILMAVRSLHDSFSERLKSLQANSDIAVTIVEPEVETSAITTGTLEERQREIGLLRPYISRFIEKAVLSGLRQTTAYERVRLQIPLQRTVNLKIDANPIKSGKAS